MRLPPPVYFLGALGLQFLARTDLPLVTWSLPYSRPASTALGALALVWIGWAFTRFRASETPVDPFAQPVALIREGPYRFSRNPLYLGLTLLLVAHAVRTQALGPFLVVPLFVLVVQRRFVVPEERRLADAFGAEYEAYRRSVRRWL